MIFKSVNLKTFTIFLQTLLDFINVSGGRCFCYVSNVSDVKDGPCPCSVSERNKVKQQRRLQLLQ